MNMDKNRALALTKANSKVYQEQFKVVMRQIEQAALKGEFTTKIQVMSDLLSVIMDDLYELGYGAEPEMRVGKNEILTTLYIKWINND